MNSLFAELFAATRGGPEVIVMIMLVFGAALVIRLLAGRQDDARIRREIERKGGTVINILWNPLGPGWFGEKSDRIYEVTYRDRNGNTIVANCKTSMFSGVYWTDPRIVERASGKIETEHQAESIKCIKCGNSIASLEARCSKCGWTYLT